MNADVVIIGAGPAGIFTALEMVKKGSKQKIIMVEKGQAVENRHCPKDKTKKCVNCKPYCHITTGFYYGYPGQYYENSRYIREWQVVALVTECDEAGNAVISLRNKFRTGDTVELVGPDLRPFSMTVPEMRDEAGTVIEEPRNPQMLLKLRLPRPVPPMTLVRHQVELSAK